MRLYFAYAHHFRLGVKFQSLVVTVAAWSTSEIVVKIALEFGLAGEALFKLRRQKCANRNGMVLISLNSHLHFALRVHYYLPFCCCFFYACCCCCCCGGGITFQASHVDLFRASSRVPPSRRRGTREEAPKRTAWVAMAFAVAVISCLSP